jgi:hypothetical protein
VGKAKIDAGVEKPIDASIAGLEARIEAAVAEVAACEEQLEAARELRDRAIREAIELGMTTTAAARRAGLSQSTVMHILAKT